MIIELSQDILQDIPDLIMQNIPILIFYYKYNAKFIKHNNHYYFDSVRENNNFFNFYFDELNTSSNQTNINTLFDYKNMQTAIDQINTLDEKMLSFIYDKELNTDEYISLLNSPKKHFKIYKDFFDSNFEKLKKSQLNKFISLFVNLNKQINIRTNKGKIGFF